MVDITEPLLNKDLTQFMQSLSRVHQIQARETKEPAAIAGRVTLD